MPHQSITTESFTEERGSQKLILDPSRDSETWKPTRSALLYRAYWLNVVLLLHSSRELKQTNTIKAFSKFSDKTWVYSESNFKKWRTPMVAAAVKSDGATNYQNLHKSLRTILSTYLCNLSGLEKSVRLCTFVSNQRMANTPTSK